MNSIPSSGHVSDRKQFLIAMMFQGSVVVFIVLLGACAAKQEYLQEEIDVKTETKQQQTNKNQEPSSDKSIQQSQVKQNQQQLSPDNNNVPRAMDKARADQKQAVQLEDKLDASLQEFDDMLLKKNQRIHDSVQGEATAAGSMATHQGAQTGSSQFENNVEIIEDLGGSGQAISGTQRQVPDVNSDDIVAQQIKEAAENETDPELKKKLWAEYKRYKSGSH